MDYTKYFETQFRPLETFEDFNPHYFDFEYGADLHWGEDLYHKRLLQFRRDDNPQTDENDPVIEEHKLSRAFHCTLAAKSRSYYFKRNKGISASMRISGQKQPARRNGFPTCLSRQRWRTSVYSPFISPRSQL